MGIGDAPVGLVVLADEPALFFSSVSTAEGYLEAIDVDNGIYPLAYGANGELYNLTSDGRRVYIEPNHKEVPRPKELREILIAALSARGEEVSEEFSLKMLLKLSQRYVDDW